MREHMEILIAVAVILGMGVLFLWGEHHRIEEQLNYKYHLVCGDTDHGVVYRLKEKHGLFKFERPYEENKQYTVSAAGCTYVKVGD